MSKDMYLYQCEEYLHELMGMIEDRMGLRSYYFDQETSELLQKIAKFLES